MTSDTLHGRAETPPTSPYDPLPIGPAEVRAGVDRELRALAALGLHGPVAVERAIAITAGKIRNSALLAERQQNGAACHVCGQRLDGTRPEVAILNPGGRVLHLHHGACHEAHSARKAALVDRIMRAAGYGAETTGAAA